MVSKNVSAAVMASDAKRSAKWFKEKLGFVISTEGHWVTVWPKGSTAKVHLCEGEVEPGNTGIAFYCADPKKEAAQLKKKGVEFAKDVTVESWGTYALIKDPDGNEFWLLKGSP